MSETKIRYLDEMFGDLDYKRIYFLHDDLGEIEVTVLQNISKYPNSPVVTVRDSRNEIVANPPPEAFDAARVAFARNWEVFMTKHPEHPKAGQLREIIARI